MSLRGITPSPSPGPRWPLTSRDGSTPVLCTVWKFVESGKTGRVLLVVTVSLFTRAPFAFFPCRADSVVLERDDLFLREEDGLEHCADDTGLNSEMTRACENPHNQHDVVAIDEYRCNRQYCSDFVDVPRQGGACSVLVQTEDK